MIVVGKENNEYDIISPEKASTQDAHLGEDDMKYMTPKKTEESKKYRRFNGRIDNLNFMKVEEEYGSQRVDILSSSANATMSDKYTDGFVKTFFWDNRGAHDTQLLIPNNAGKRLAIRARENTNNWKEWKQLPFYDEVFYKPGDVVNFQKWQEVFAPGLLTNSRSQIKFSITMPKSMANVNGVILRGFKANIRHSTGGYIGTSAYVSGGYNFFTDNTISIPVQISLDNVLSFSINKTSAYDGTTNNTPVALSVNHLHIEFT